MSLAQRVVKYQRESLEFQQKLKEANTERAKLEQELKQLKAQLANFHQPQSYLVLNQILALKFTWRAILTAVIYLFNYQIDKLGRKEQELQAALNSSAQLQQQFQELRHEYSQAMDAKMSLQKQLQQVLARREDLDILKSSVQLLRHKLQTKSSQQQQQQQIQSSSPSNFYASSSSEKQSLSRYFQEIGPKKLRRDEDKTPPFMKVSPPPSIASKMTEAPARSQQFAATATAADREQPQGSTTGSPPRWYTKLRS